MCVSKSATNLVCHIAVHSAERHCSRHIVVGEVESSHKAAAVVEVAGSRNHLAVEEEVRSLAEDC